MALPSFLTEFAVNQCGEQPKRKLITLHKDIVCCQLGSWSPSWSLTCCKGAECPELGVQRCLWGWDSILKASLNCSGNKTQVRCNKSRQCDSSSGYLNITLTLQSKLAALQTHTYVPTNPCVIFIPAGTGVLHLHLGTTAGMCITGLHALCKLCLPDSFWVA